MIYSIVQIGNMGRIQWGDHVAGMRGLKTRNTCRAVNSEIVKCVTKMGRIRNTQNSGKECFWRGAICETEKEMRV